jgi:hypothetical protein
MKRSANFSYTRKRRNPLKDMALFLQDLGLPKDEIVKAVTEAHAKMTEIKPLPDSEVAEIEAAYQKSLTIHRFYCPKEDCDNRPFEVRPSELADADGWVACDVCGGVCEELSK